jgi:hypothetical protein
MFHEPLTSYQLGSSWSGIALPEDMQHSGKGRDPMLSGAQSPVKQGFPVRTPGSATSTMLDARTFTNSGRTAHSVGYKPSQGS